MTMVKSASLVGIALLVLILDGKTSLAQISVTRSRHGQEIYNYNAPTAVRGRSFAFGPITRTRTTSGLTANGTIFANNLLGTVERLGQTVIPLIPQFVSPASAAMLDGEDQAAVAAPADATLDALADPDRHRQRMADLNAVLADTHQIVRHFGGTPVSRPTTSSEPPIRREGSGNGTFTGKVLPLRVIRFAGVNIADAEVRDLLAFASNFLQNPSVTGDPAVNLRLELSGPVETYSDSDLAIITTNPQMARLKSKFRDYDVIIVDDIRICGSTVGAGIIGCAAQDRNVQIVVQRPRGFSGDTLKAMEAVLWTHELGHNGGANHRNGTNLLMSPVVRATNFRVSSTEEKQLLSLRPGAPAAAMVEPHHHHAAVAEIPPLTLNVITEVTQTYVEGPPWAAWRNYWAQMPEEAKQNPVDLLAAMLNDALLVEHHAKMIAMLIAIDTDASLTLAMQYIETFNPASPDPITKERWALDAVGAGLFYLGQLDAGANRQVQFEVDGAVEPKAIADFIEDIMERISERSIGMMAGLVDDAAAPRDPLLTYRIEAAFAEGIYGLASADRMDIVEDFVSEAEAAQAQAAVLETGPINLRLEAARTARLFAPE